MSKDNSLCVRPVCAVKEVGWARKSLEDSLDIARPSSGTEQFFVAVHNGRRVAAGRNVYGLNSVGVQAYGFLPGLATDFSVSSLAGI